MAIETLGLYPVSLDVYKKHKESTVYANENDFNGRGLLVTVTKNNAPFDCTGMTLKLGFRNAVGEERLYDFTPVDITLGTFKVMYPTEMLVGNGGRVVKAEVKAYEGTGALLNYAPLFVYVNSSEITDDALAGTNEASYLSKLTDEVAYVQTQLGNITPSQIDFVSTAETNRVNAETTRGNSETSRVNAESSRATAESNRVTAESDRVTAEDLRETAEATREANDIARGTYVEAIEANYAPELNLVKSQLAETKTKADAMASGSPKEVYTTLVALQTAFPTGTTGAYLVTADGKWYYWSGTAWTAGGTYQTTGIADNTITPQKTTFFEPTRNIFNTTWVANAIDSSGGESPSANYRVSGYIPVTPLAQYYYNHKEINLLSFLTAFYDVNKVFISRVSQSTMTGEKGFTIPANAYYVRVIIYSLTVSYLNVSECQLELGTAKTPYIEPLNFHLSVNSVDENKIAGNSISTQKIKDEAITPQKLSFVGLVAPTNLYDKNDLGFLNGYLSNAGVLTASASFKTTPVITLEAGTYVFSGAVGDYGAANAGAVCRYTDASGATFLTGFTATQGTQLDAFRYIYTFTLTAKSYVRLNVGTVSNPAKYIDIFMLVKSDTYPTEYSAYFDKYYLLNSDVKSAKSDNQQDNLLYKKKVLWEGDSICQGAGYLGGYGGIIAVNNSMESFNTGIGGGTIAYFSDLKHCVSRSVSAMQATADYIIFQGGINDYWNNVPLGDIIASFTGPFDDTTFCGALESIFSQAQLKWKGKKIGFIISHKIYGTYDILNKNMSEMYWEKAREICRKWSVPYIDLFNESGMNYGLVDVRAGYSKLNESSVPDGCHPNEAGYREFLVPKIEAWMKML